MDRRAQFFDEIKSRTEMTLVTAEGGSVTMRIVAPVYYEDKVLIFTSADSLKYRQLRANPGCCMEVGAFFAEATAELMGSTMLDSNAALRQAYSEKFPGAFDEGILYGGRAADFVLLKPVRLKGWAFLNDVPTPDGIPNEPFEIEL